MSRPMRIFSTMIITTLQIIVHVPNVISGIMAEHVYGVAVNGELPMSALTMRFTPKDMMRRDITKNDARYALDLM